MTDPKEITRDAAALETAVDLIALRLAELTDPGDRYVLARVLGRVERIRERILRGPDLAWEDAPNG